MNQMLYENIKNELNNLYGEAAMPKNVSELLGKHLIGKNADDRLAVLVAFYEYMHKMAETLREYSFVKTDKTWIEYYKRNISNCFSKEKIKSDISDIVYDKKLTDIILNICSDDVKKAFYEASEDVVSTFLVEEENLGKINVSKNIKESSDLNSKTKSEEQNKLKVGLLLSELNFNNLSKYKISKEETIFDKIARCPNEILMNIVNFINNGKQINDTIKKVSLENNDGLDKSYVDEENDSIIKVA